MRKHSYFTILFALLMTLAVVFPAFAQEATEEPETDTDTVELIGTIEVSEDDDGEDDDIIFTTTGGDVYIIAPAGSFNPSTLADLDPETVFTLTGTVLNDEDPPTLRASLLVEFDATTDTDGDGVLDIDDNCIDIPNPDQLNSDLDAEGDACDEFPLDSDNDGITDDEDECPFVADEVDADDASDDEDETSDVDPCEEANDEDEDEMDDEDEGEGDGGFYCRNRDIQHPAGARIVDASDGAVTYEEIIAIHCGDDGENKVGWGVIRRELGITNGNGNGNNGNGNGNGNNGNGNGNGNNGNGNGNNGNGNGNGNGNNGNGNGNNGNGNGNNGNGNGNNGNGNGNNGNGNG